MTGRRLGEGLKARLAATCTFLIQVLSVWIQGLADSPKPWMKTSFSIDFHICVKPFDS